MIIRARVACGKERKRLAAVEGKLDALGHELGARALSESCQYIDDKRGRGRGEPPVNRTGTHYGVEIGRLGATSEVERQVYVRENQGKIAKPVALALDPRAELVSSDSSSVRRARQRCFA